VAGFDCNEDAIAAIKDGRMYLSYNSDPFSSAWCAAVYLVMYLNDGTLPPQKFIPYPPSNRESLITKDKVDKFMRDYCWWKQ